MRLTLPFFILSMAAPLASAQTVTLNLRADQNADGSMAPHSVPEVAGQAVGPSNPLPVSGTFSASVSGFAPNGNVQPITASTTSGSTALPAGTVVEIANTGPVQARIRFGGATVTAATTDLPIDPNEKPCFTVGTNTNLAAITAGGSTTLAVVAGAERAARQVVAVWVAAEAPPRSPAARTHPKARLATRPMPATATRR